MKGRSKALMCLLAVMSLLLSGISVTQVKAADAPNYSAVVSQNGVIYLLSDDNKQVLVHVEQGTSVDTLQEVTFPASLYYSTEDLKKLLQEQGCYDDEIEEYVSSSNYVSADCTYGIMQPENKVIADKYTLSYQIQYTTNGTTDYDDVEEEDDSASSVSVADEVAQAEQNDVNYVRFTIWYCDEKGNATSDSQVLLVKIPTADDYVPTITNATYEKTGDGAYKVTVTGNSGGYDCLLSKAFAIKADGETQALSYSFVDEGYIDSVDYEIDDLGNFTIVLPNVTGGEILTFYVTNEFGNTSGYAIMQNTEAPSALNSDDNSDTNGLTLKVSKPKLKDGVANAKATVNKKSQIYIDGALQGTASVKDGLTLKFIANGTYTVMAVDKDGNAKEVEVTVSCFKDEDTSDDFTAREAWNNGENDGKLPQTGTATVGTVLVIIAVVFATGVIILRTGKKEGE